MKRFFGWLFRKPDPDLVPYRDFETGRTVWVPKAELAPGVVLIQIQGEAAPVYADAAQLKPGAYQHPPFEGEEVAAIRSLMRDLEDVYPLSYEEWEDGFRRDKNPSREIAIWLHIAAILRFMDQKHAFDSGSKKECYRVLLACLTGGRDTVCQRSRTGLLSPNQIDETVQYFYEGGYDG